MWKRGSKSSGSTTPQQRRDDIKEPLVDGTSNTYLTELRLREDQVDVIPGSVHFDQNYNNALSRMALAVAVGRGYDEVKITSLVHNTTTAGSHRGGGQVARVPCAPHFTLRVKSSHFPTCETTLHVNVHVRNSAGGFDAFESRAEARADRRLYPLGYPYQNIEVKSTSMDVAKMYPMDAYRAMYDKWRRKQDQKAKQKARTKGDSGDWPEDDDQGGAAGISGTSGPSGSSSYYDSGQGASTTLGGYDYGYGGGGQGNSSQASGGNHTAYYAPNTSSSSGGAYYDLPNTSTYGNTSYYQY